MAERLRRRPGSAAQPPSVTGPDRAALGSAQPPSVTGPGSAAPPAWACRAAASLPRRHRRQVGLGRRGWAGREEGGGRESARSAPLRGPGQPRVPGPLRARWERGAHPGAEAGPAERRLWPAAGVRAGRGARSGAERGSAVPAGGLCRAEGPALPPPGAGRGRGHRPAVACARREDGGLGGGAACPLQLSPCFFLSHLRHSCEGRSALCKHLRAPVGPWPWGACSCGVRSRAAGGGCSAGSCPERPSICLFPALQGRGTVPSPWPWGALSL